MGPVNGGLRGVGSRRHARDVWKASLENGDDGIVMGEREDRRRRRRLVGSRL